LALVVVVVAAAAAMVGSNDNRDSGIVTANVVDVKKKSDHKIQS
jgi:hypothetical protein